MNSYYDSHNSAIILLASRNLGSLSQDALQSLGLYPVVSSTPNYSKYTEKVIFGEFVRTGNTYSQSYTINPQSIDELTSSLTRLKREKDLEFAASFRIIDDKRARSVSAITEATSLGDTPTPADVDILGQLNMIAEENRAILSEIQATEIIPSMAPATAVETVTRVLETTPWLPWLNPGVSV